MFENSVQQFYLQEVKKVNSDRKKRLAAIKNRKQALAYVKEVHQKIAKAFNLPKSKCPLNAKIVKEQKINNITVKNVIYESRKDFPVTALLFMPETSGKHPASIFLCGHAEEGKASDTYQRGALNLAEQGFVVLLIDPVSQGERHQFVNVSDKLPGCCVEHNYQGKQLHLTGEYFGAWRAWDAIRGIDYLMSLPEVDTNRVAVTGNSGGGTMTTFVNALDDRLCMAAPSCYITTWLREVENELPADVEQMPPHAMEFGLDMADFIIAQAPRPSIILGQKNDFFDPRGTLEAYEDAKHIYSLLGAEDNIEVFIGPDSHGYHLANREAMYNFFGKHALNKTEKISENAALQILKPEDTYCSCDGEIFKQSKYRKLREINREIAEKLIAKRKKLSKDELRKKLSKLLAIGKIEAPYYRKLRPGRQFDGQCEIFSRWGLETEDGIVMSVLKLYHETWFNYIPEAENAILYISHLDADKEIRKTYGFNRKDFVFALDVRGIGELVPSGCDRYSRAFFGQYLFDYHFASLGVMFNKPYLGGKVRDILCALELLKANGVKNITLKAESQGTIPALIAAVLSDIPVAVELDNMPESWKSVIDKDMTAWPLSATANKILAVTDLDEMRKLLPNLKYTVADEPVKE